MRKKLTQLVLFALLLSSVLQAPMDFQHHAVGQTSGIVPRFVDGMTITLRDGSMDYNFISSLTPDGNYLIGMSGDAGDTVYLWELGQNDGSIQYPDAIQLDVSQFRFDAPRPRVSMAIVDNDSAIIQLDTYLIHISIPDLEILATKQVDLFDPEIYTWRSVSVFDNRYVVARYSGHQQLALWDLESDDLSQHRFDFSLSSIRQLDDKWLFSASADDMGNTQHLICDLKITICESQIIVGAIRAYIDGVIVTGQSPNRPLDIEIPVSYWRLEGYQLIETERIYDVLPQEYFASSISPDGQYIIAYRGDEVEIGGFGQIGAVFTIDGDLVDISVSFRDSRWIGDHYLLAGTVIWDASTMQVVDVYNIYAEVSYDGIYSNHAFHYISAVSADATRAVYIPGGSAIIFDIEYRDTSNILGLGESVLEIELVDRNRTKFSNDNQYFYLVQDLDIYRWNIATGEMWTIDISDYTRDRPEFSLAEHEDGDLYLMTSKYLLLIDFEDTSVEEIYVTEDTFTGRMMWAFLVPFSEGIRTNGDYVGALFDNTLVVIHGDEIIQKEISGRRLYPYENGWLIYMPNYGTEPPEHRLTFCSLDLEICSSDTISDQVGVFWSEDELVVGNATLLELGDITPPAYYRLNLDVESFSVEPSSPFVALPSEGSFPLLNLGDVVVALTEPAQLYQDPRTHILWSPSENERLSRYEFTNWYQFEDTIIFQSTGGLVFYDLVTQDYVYYDILHEYFSFIVSDDGQHLAILHQEGITIHEIE